GDLSENAEYHMAKQRQEFVRARLSQLKKRVSDLSMINMNNIPRDRAALGSTVLIYDATKGEEIEYKLVTSEESDVKKGLISTSSPIGRAVMGKKFGDRSHSDRESRAGNPETDHHSRRGRMTWTSAFGRACGVVLYKIVDGLALTRISPNLLTFIGLVINIAAALLFGFASADNNQPLLFRWAAVVIIGAGIFDMVDGRVARATNQVTEFGG